MLDTERFRAPYAAIEIGNTVKTNGPGTMLDVGGGHGVHANFFRSKGLQTDIVDIIDGVAPRFWIGDFIDFQPAERYDYVWASHVLEHSPNPGLFIRKLAQCAKPGGLIAVTVPPLKTEMTFGHVTLWNAGLLLINFIKCGIDCRQAKLCTYGYNVSIIAPNYPISDDRYHLYLPSGVQMRGSYFEGDVASIGFSVKNIPADERITGFEDLPPEAIASQLAGSAKPGFVLSRKANNPGPRFYWWDAGGQRLVLVA